MLITYLSSLVFLGFRVIPPDTVVEGGGQAEPGQVWRQEESGGPVHWVPGHHGGTHCASQQDKLKECLRSKSGDIDQT